MPKIIGNVSRVVHVEGVFSIDEYVGNVGSHTDDISIAKVCIDEPTSEPWLTLQYDEWMVVLKGYLEIHTSSGSAVAAAAAAATTTHGSASGNKNVSDDDGHHQILTVKEGETVFIAKGERFKPVFPQAGAEYIPVCIPAFRPDRCLREEEGGADTSDVAKTLAVLHSNAAASAAAATVPTLATTPSPSTTTQMASSSAAAVATVYHMCQRTLWDAAVATGKAYFPPTFREDGFFTHATAVPARLLDTANHFYTSTEGTWICLALSTERLEDLGIMTRFEEPKPVGQQDVSDNWNSNQWACPHIYGGIPTLEQLGIVTQIYEMKRDEQGTFLAVVGLTDV